MFTLDASVHSSGNLFLPFSSLWENVYFIMSNMERHFTEAILCRLAVILNSEKQFLSVDYIKVYTRLSVLFNCSERT